MVSVILFSCRRIILHNRIENFLHNMLRIGVAARASVRALRPGKLVYSDMLRHNVGTAIRPNAFSGVRFNSTGPSEVKNTLTSFDEVTEKVSTMTSDQIGYLDSIGMAQGFGPTALLERFLEVTHVYTGLPWWGSIAVATVIARVFLFPLYMSALSNAAKLNKVKPEMDRILLELKTSESTQDKYLLMQERKKLMKDNDVTMYKQMYPMLQLPIAYGFFQALRKMSAHPVQGFQEQGYAWFNDLTSVDPYLGLHGISAVLILLLVRSGGEMGQALAMTAPVKKMLMILPFVSILITKDFYASVMVYVATNSLCSVFQTLTLRSQMFRKMMKMPANVKPQITPSTEKSPETISEWIGQQKKSFDDLFEAKTKLANRKLEAQVVRRRNGVDGFIKRHDK